MTVQIREFQPRDALALSELIRLTMKRSNSSDYSAAYLLPLINYFSPAKVELLSRERLCLVADEVERIVGTAAIDGHQVCTFFVHPEHQRQGVGTALLTALEDAAHKRGLRQLQVEASLTGVSFYERKGYGRTGKMLDSATGPRIELRKRLIP